MQKVVIVTGGTRGIGLGIAKRFLENQYRVVLNYRSDEQNAANVLAEFNSKDALLVKADVTHKQERENLLAKTIEAFGQIDVLVNNAAIASRLGFFKTTEEEFDRLISCNLKAPVFLTQLVAKHMIDRGSSGAIVNIASVAGHRVFGNSSLYGMTKAGLLMATKTMAVKLAPHSIRVNSITPGTTKTDLNRRNWQDNPDKFAEHTKTIPMQRAAVPDEIAGAALYLASDHASFTTGAEIVIDGGQIC